MPSQVMAVVPVIMNSLHKDVMRGRKERLGELWAVSYTHLDVYKRQARSPAGKAP